MIPAILALQERATAIEARLDRLERIASLVGQGFAPPTDPAYADAYRVLQEDLEALHGLHGDGT